MLRSLIYSFIFFSTTITTILSSSIPEQSTAKYLPEEFFVNQRLLSWTTSFDVESKELKLGYVHRRFLSLAIQYDFYDVQEKLQATARQRFFSFGSLFDITDVDENTLGTVEERIFTFFPTFTIVSPTGQILADASLNFWGTTYTLTSPLIPNSEPIATLSRPFINWWGIDNWTVKILKPEVFNENNIDPRLFVVVMAFQTDRDTWAAQKKNKAFSDSNPFEQNKFLEQLGNLQNELERVADKLEEITPSIEDFEKATALVESYLAKETSPDAQSIKLDDSWFVTFYNKLIQLIDGDQMTIQEKAALHQLLQERLNRAQE